MSLPLPAEPLMLLEQGDVANTLLVRGLCLHQVGSAQH